jgi:hypothetical protein
MRQDKLLTKQIRDKKQNLFYKAFFDGNTIVGPCSRQNSLIHMFPTMLKRSNPFTISNANTSMKGFFLFSFLGVFFNLF